ncbi:prolipoprotein diacylglyceryltransferase [Aquimarina sp. MAR_2010_214]|uniref:prolipoprotein diacylglyceryl transferase n=1 Tax=Aquimarina sp. MAR_2010_214 TaxID=1250026 RepID=UPI000C7008FC|nr:prolipoprotein diacylglyceryl transferase family protein [Aquimarina sp. MAR_2010_214]PKV52490.1 prolipoprotein diacylglyceryltransferase [Aquimarina sp. MAR_2010_214]
MDIPFEPIVFGYKVNIHLILEYAAFFIGFRYYIYLKKRSQDSISSSNRLSIIIGAVFGAFLGSRFFGFLENPIFSFSPEYVVQLLSAKTIMGGLFGGLLGVELAKKIIREKHSSGDLFTFPIILGIIIGRTGCFLAGVKEFTYGKQTTSFLGMDLGDGLYRYPIALFEVVFLLVLWGVLRYFQTEIKKESGLLFKYFMISYFLFRFCIEFLKPNTFFVLGLSSIQYLCILCMIYYQKTIRNFFHAH